MKLLSFRQFALATIVGAVCFCSPAANTEFLSDALKISFSEASAKELQSMKARVVRVADGDTVTVVEEGKPDCRQEMPVQDSSFGD